MRLSAIILHILDHNLGIGWMTDDAVYNTNSDFSSLACYHKCFETHCCDSYLLWKSFILAKIISLSFFILFVLILPAEDRDLSVLHALAEMKKVLVHF